MKRSYGGTGGGLVVLFAVIACSGDSTGVQPTERVPQALGQVGIEEWIGSPSPPDTLEFHIAVGNIEPGHPFIPGALLVELVLTDADSGASLTLDASNRPDFADAVAALTDGAEGYVQVRWGNGRIAMRESEFFQGGITGDYLPDFAGTEITHALLHIDRVRLDSPSTDGSLTRSELSARLVIMGHP